MSNYVNDLWPGSPRHQDSPSASASGRSSRPSSRSRSRSSSRSRSWSRSSSRRSRSRSHSRSRRRQRRFRRYSRSYSRSRSRTRTRSRRFRHGYGARPRRDRRSRSRSPPRSRSRSRSRGGWRPRRAFPADPRARRHYGFGRTVDPEELRRRRARSRSRSRSHSPFRLSEKDRMELLEIAKANAAKALGTTNLILPPSLQAVLAAKDTSQGAKTELSEKETEDETKYPTEKSQQRNIAFSSNNSVAKPIQKTANAAEVTSSGSPKIDKKKSPYGLWKPV